MAYHFKSTKSLLIIMATGASLFLVSCKGQRASLDQPENNSDRNTSSKEAKNINKVISTARSYIGTKYKYGGCSREGIDCSGLVYTCYKTIDKELPRTAGAQSQFGQAVKITDLRKGDLLFFTDQKGHTKITHGKISFIHASTRSGVIEANLLSAYYKPLFLKAVRVI
jgi:cell wall-associated NlpC family hydrolase